MEFTSIKLIKEITHQIDCYRANSGCVTIYLKNGDVLYVKEDFLTVTNLLK